ncbi:DUF3265 domain-containing protein [Vibrio kanaloae]|nr:DUF3265 domain-containing protein [Vibrio kanaloae]
MALNLWLHHGSKLTKRLRQTRNAWHFYYALIYVFKVLCGGFVLRCSLLSLALALQGSYGICIRELSCKSKLRGHKVCW